MRFGIGDTISQTQLKLSASQMCLSVMLNEIIDAIKGEVVSQVIFDRISVGQGTDAAVMDSTRSPSRGDRGKEQIS